MRRSNGRGSTVDLRLLIKTVGRDEDLPLRAQQTQERMRPSLCLRLHYIPLLFWIFLSLGVIVCTLIQHIWNMYLSWGFLPPRTCLRSALWIVMDALYTNQLQPTVWKSGVDMHSRKKSLHFWSGVETHLLLNVVKKGEAISARANKSNTGVKHKRILFW